MKSMEELETELDLTAADILSEGGEEPTPENLRRQKEWLARSCIDSNCEELKGAALIIHKLRRRAGDPVSANIGEALLKAHMKAIRRENETLRRLLRGGPAVAGPAPLPGSFNPELLESDAERDPDYALELQEESARRRVLELESLLAAIDGVADHRNRFEDWLEREVELKMMLERERLSDLRAS